ncbi:HYDIN, partial [Symbiodinium sp. KB8]
MSGAAGAGASAAAAGDEDSGGVRIIDLVNIADFTAQSRCSVPVGTPLFAPSAQRIEFRDYAPFEATTARLALRNVDTVPRRVRVAQPDHPSFAVRGPLDSAGAPLKDSRIAPGVEAVFTVVFTPAALADYRCDLVVSTERERFVLPLRAYGPQPFLTFPDRLTFDSTAAKTTASRPFMVKNIGRSDCTFSLLAEPPFTVAPTSGHVPVGASMQVTVGFKPPEARPYEGAVEVRYSSGAAAAMVLEGEGHDVDVRTTLGLIEVPPTYTGLTSTATVTLVNDSEVPVSFDWKALALPQHEEEERSRLVAQLRALCEQEREALLMAAGAAGGAVGSVGSHGGEAKDEDDGDGDGGVAFFDEDSPGADRRRLGRRAAPWSRSQSPTPGPGQDEDSLELEGTAGHKASPARSRMDRDEAAAGGQARKPPSGSAAAAAVRRAAGEDDDEASGDDTDEEGSEAGGDVGGALFNAAGGGGSFVLGGGSLSSAFPTQSRAAAGGRGGAGGEDRVPLAVSTELAALERKFRALERQAEVEPLRFTDAAFSIEPASGQVWARATQEFTVTFTPPLAADYAITSFLEVQGRSRRIPLELRAVGLGPRAVFTYDVLDVGDVSVTAVREYELTLVNKGEIPCHWAVRDPASQGQGRQFGFEPSAGTLPVGGSVPIVVRFSSRVLGEFAEVFEFELEGSRDLLRVEFRGHVVAPTFHADREAIDFGGVAFAFTYEERLTITNTSDVPFKAVFRVPDDRPGNKAEFAMEPPDAVLEPGERGEVLVRFTPDTVGEYARSLSVDVQGVGESLLSLPVAASCSAPDVAVVTRTIDFGTAFVGHPVLKQLQLRNTSDRAGRYEVLPQDGHAAAVAAFVALPPSGDVPPGALCAVDISLTVKRVGETHLPLMVRVLGQEGPPTIVELMAVGSGPVIEPEPPAARFGRAPCLRPTALPVQLRNASDIPARLRMFVRGDPSRFSIGGGGGELEIEPRGTGTVTMLVEPDDVAKLSDELCIEVDGGEQVRVPLSAVGSGTTMHCDQDVSIVDMGTQYTGVDCERVFVLENRGRRTQTLSWLNATHRAAAAERMRLERMGPAAAAKAASGRGGGVGGGRGRGRGRGKGRAGASQEEDAGPVFVVEPDSATVKPRTAVTFRFRARRESPCACAEELHCTSKMQGETKTATIFKCAASATFVDPVIKAEPEVVRFDYVWRKPDLAGGDAASAAGAPSTTASVDTAPDDAAPMTGSVLLTNVTPLPVTFRLRCAAPFEAEQAEMTLAAGASGRANLAFHPGYRGDRQSHTAEGRLTLDFAGHASRVHVPMQGAISFPNVELGAEKVDFGCVVNETTKTVQLRLRNPTAAAVEYSWAFEEDDAASRARAASRGVPFVPVNEAFDVVPIRGRLGPFEVETADVSFFGHPGRRFAARAVLEVVGGPEYALPLSGAASSAGYRLDRQLLDFGSLHFEREGEEEVWVHNTGKVDVSFSVRTDLVSRRGRVAVSPRRGHIPAGGKAKVLVRLRPGTPGPVAETLVLEVGQFDPVEVAIVGEATYSQVACSLQRQAVPGWAEACVRAAAALRARAEEARSAGASGLQASGLPPAAGGDAFVDDDDEIEAEAAEAAAATARLAGATAAAAAAAGDGASTDGPGATAAASAELIPDPSVVEVEQEAGRLLFGAFLEDLLELREAAAQGDESASVSASVRGGGGGGVTARSTARDRLATARSSGSVLGGGGGGGGSSGSTVGQRRAPASERFVGGRFVCDFGPVVRGTTKRRTFRITNVGSTAASLLGDVAAATAEGFALDPATVTKMPPGGSVDVTVTLRPAAKKRLGVVQAEVPVTVTGGPAMVLVLRALVTLPELRLSPAALDFGKDMLAGQERTVSLQLHNVAPVPARWEKAPLVGAPAVVKDGAFFEMEPSHGTLGPGQRCIVRVTFSPRQARSYAIAFPIRVANNPRVIRLPLAGAATAVDLRFSPPAATLPAVLPCNDPASESGVSFVDVRVTNAGTSDVEAFLVGHDDVYAAECQTLSAAFAGALPEYEGGTGGALTIDRGRLKLPPRAAGEGLPDELVQAAKRAAVEARAKAAAEESKEEDGDGEGGDAADGKSQLSADGGGDAEAGAGDAAAAVSELAVAPAAAPRMQARAVNVVVVAPPGGGGSAVAARIATNFGCPSITLDDAVAWAAAGGGGRALQAKVKSALDAAEALRAAEEAERAAAAEEAAAAAGGKGKGKKAPAKKPAAKKGAAAEDDQPPAPVAPAPRALLPEALVAECLAERSRRVDCAAGVV